MVECRKPHECWGCEKEIIPGEMARKVVCAGGYDGFSSAYYYCECEEWLIENWSEADDGVSKGMVRERREEAEEDGDEIGEIALEKGWV